MAQMYELIPVPGYPGEYALPVDQLPVKEWNSSFEVREDPLLPQLMEQELKKSRVIEVSERPGNFRLKAMSEDSYPSSETSSSDLRVLGEFLRLAPAPGIPATKAKNKLLDKPAARDRAESPADLREAKIDTKTCANLSAVLEVNPWEVKKGPEKVKRWNSVIELLVSNKIAREGPKEMHSLQELTRRQIYNFKKKHCEPESGKEEPPFTVKDQLIQDILHLLKKGPKAKKKPWRSRHLQSALKHLHWECRLEPPNVHLQNWILRKFVWFEEQNLEAESDKCDFAAIANAMELQDEIVPVRPNGQLDELTYARQKARDPSEYVEAAAAQVASNDKNGLSIRTKHPSSKISLPSAKVNPEPRVRGKEPRATVKQLANSLKSSTRSDLIDRKFERKMRDLDRKIDREIFEKKWPLTKRRTACDCSLKEGVLCIPCAVSSSKDVFQDQPPYTCPRAVPTTDEPARSSVVL